MVDLRRPITGVYGDACWPRSRNQVGLAGRSGAAPARMARPSSAGLIARWRVQTNGPGRLVKEPGRTLANPPRAGSSCSNLTPARLSAVAWRPAGRSRYIRRRLRGLQYGPRPCFKGLTWGPWPGAHGAVGTTPRSAAGPPPPATVCTSGRGRLGRGRTPRRAVPPPPGVGGGGGPRQPGKRALTCSRSGSGRGRPLPRHPPAKARLWAYCHGDERVGPRHDQRDRGTSSSGFAPGFPADLILARAGARHRRDGAATTRTSFGAAT